MDGIRVQIATLVNLDDSISESFKSIILDALEGKGGSDCRVSPKRRVSTFKAAEMLKMKSSMIRYYYWRGVLTGGKSPGGHYLEIDLESIEAFGLIGGTRVKSCVQH